MNQKMLKYCDGILEAGKRKNDIALADALTLALVNIGLCSSYQHSSWRIVTLPECPLSVQLEFEEGYVDIVPLSSYTESLDVSFPLSGYPVPHHVRVEFSSRDDIDTIVSMIATFFPKHHVEKAKNTTRRKTIKRS